MWREPAPDAAASATGPAANGHHNAPPVWPAPGHDPANPWGGVTLPPVMFQQPAAAPVPVTPVPVTPAPVTPAQVTPAQVTPAAVAPAPPLAPAAPGPNFAPAAPGPHFAPAAPMPLGFFTPQPAGQTQTHTGQTQTLAAQAQNPPSRTPDAVDVLFGDTLPTAPLLIPALLLSPTLLSPTVLSPQLSPTQPPPPLTPPAAEPTSAPTSPGSPTALLDRTGAPIRKLTRPRDGRIIGGVAAGIADHLHVPVVWVRVTFCVLGLLSGVGVLAYALLWIFAPQAEGSGRRAPTATERRQAIGIAALGAALAVLGTAFGLGQSFGWVIGPLGLAAVGGAFIWREADDAQRQRWRKSANVVVAGSGLWRVLGGAVLVVGGLAVFALGQFNLGATGTALLAVVLTLVGVAIIAIPWWVRLVRDLGSERRQLVVQQERAEIAAHLHDSVLQTLALIQRQAGDSREVLRLSRSQERELRSWLYGPAGYATAASADEAVKAATIAVALTIAAGEVEDTYAVKVTPVVVGDTAMDSDMTALVAASREAMVNAAKHAGNPDISVYAEVEDDAVTVFVRDRGVGFDPHQVGADRRGLAESIRGRMDRHHGRATVRSTPGEGTEIELRMPITVRTAEPEFDAPEPAARGEVHTEQR